MDTPKISVIIPSHNRVETLEKVLSFLEQQDCPLDSFQVIVVDDNSQDGTWSFLERSCKTAPLNIQAFQCSFENAGRVRNYGVSKAAADLIAFLDTDIFVRPDYISKHLAFHQTHPDENMVLLGRVETAKELLIPQQVRHEIWNPSAVHKKVFEIEWPSFRAANTSMKKSLFERVQGFDPSLYAAEDTELGYRLRKNGAILNFDNSIITTHYHPLGWAQYFEKATKYGQSIATWYEHEPKVRPELTRRYGLCTRNCSTKRRIKYGVAKLILNSRALPGVMFFTHRIPHFWAPLTRRMYKIVFQYQLIHSFREMLDNRVASAKSHPENFSCGKMPW